MKHLLPTMLMIIVVTAAVPAAAGELIAEDFETQFVPEGWSQINLGDYLPWMWGWNHNGAHSGIHTANMRPSWNSDVLEDEWLVTPACNTAGADYLTLEFYESGEDWTAQGGLHEVLISTTVADDPEAFTSV